MVGTNLPEWVKLYQHVFYKYTWVAIISFINLSPSGVFAYRSKLKKLPSQHWNEHFMLQTSKWTLRCISDQTCSLRFVRCWLGNRTLEAFSFSKQKRKNLMLKAAIWC